MKLRMIAGMLLVGIMSFGISNNAEAKGRGGCCAAKQGCAYKSHGYRSHSYHGYRSHGYKGHSYNKYRSCGSRHGNGNACGYRRCGK